MLPKIRDKIFGCIRLVYRVLNLLILIVYSHVKAFCLIFYTQSLNIILAKAFNLQTKIKD